MAKTLSVAFGNVFLANVSNSDASQDDEDIVIVGSWKATSATKK